MIFVTGATGYTGRFVVDALRESGEELRCLIHENRDGFENRIGIECVQGDLAHPDGLAAMLRGTDALVSVAHLRYAPALIGACREAGVSRAVFFSSMWRFSKVMTPDVEAVIAGESAVEQSGLAYTLLRPTMIYGPGDDRSISRLRAHLTRWHVMPIFGSGNRLVQPVYVSDVAQVVAGALRRSGAIGKAYNLAGAKAMPYGVMIDTLARLVGRAVMKVHIPQMLAIPLAFLGGRLISNFPLRVDQMKRMNEDRSADISDAISELGFAPLSFEEGVLAAMRINGELT